MRLLGLIVALLIAMTSPAETLRQVLKTNGIPDSTFSKADLDGNVNTAAVANADRVFVAYLRADDNNLLTGNPQVIQFERRSGIILRSEVKPEDADRCCGSPEGVEFIGDLVILSFHINPSAETMLVLGKDLKLVTTLYGFDEHQVGPAQIVFIENMIHFAPQHPERLRLADLHSGRTEELYPIKGDALRAQFVKTHKQHMPSEQDCQQNNDPCDPSIFDETIEFLSTDRVGEFRIRVTREATHQQVNKNDIVEIPFEQADYSFQRTKNRWYYCSHELTIGRLVKGIEHTVPRTAIESCSPNLPVLADTDADQPSPFATLEKKEK